MKNPFLLFLFYVTAPLLEKKGTGEKKNRGSNRIPTGIYLFFGPKSKNDIG